MIPGYLFNFTVIKSGPLLYWHKTAKMTTEFFTNKLWNIQNARKQGFRRDAYSRMVLFINKTLALKSGHMLVRA